MRMFAKSLVLSLVVMAGLGTGAEAQANQADSLAKYKVVKGTTLWDLSHATRGDGQKWTEIFDANIAAGILDSTKLRYAADGTPIVILAIGDSILLEKQSVTPAVTLVQEAAPVTPVQTAAVEETGYPGWLPALAIAILVAGIAVILWSLFSTKLANPVTSGPPMREGGITDESAETHFRQMASSRTGEPGSASYVPPERIRVVNIRRGRGYGLMRVRYRGNPNLELKRLTGETVYEATIERPDHSQETMYCLQGCANDLVYTGTRYFADRLFRFEPENVSVPLSPPATAVQAGGMGFVVGEDELVITHRGQSITFGADNWAVRKGTDGGIVVSERGRHDVEFVNGRIRGGAVETEARLPIDQVRATSRL